MKLYFTRRNFLSTGIAGLVAASGLRGQSQAVPVAGVPVKTYGKRSTVALTSGDDRRQNVYDALVAIDDQILPTLKTKKRVLIKPNNVMVTNQLACTHADALRGILDYLAPRFKGPITIAESAAGDTWTGFRNFKYPEMIKEYPSRQIDLVDLNEEGKFVNQALLDQDIHVVPVRLAARMFDPDAFIIGAALLKTHNYVVATMGVKNMVLGAPLHSTGRAAERYNFKASYHAGYHVIHYNMLVTAQAMRPYWGVSVIDGYEGMEGNGPTSGTPVSSRLAIASTDFVAGDRVAIECMGVDPQALGYLRYCDQVGLGNYDLAKIDVHGPLIASVRKEYRLNGDVDRQLTWRDPLDVQDGSWIGPRGRRNDRPR
jgi:uncharacterized protein (DUF362 family)